MSYELNVKELNGDWDSIVAIRGKKGDTGTPGTIFSVDAHYVEGDDVVAIADFTTNNNGVVNTQTIYAPTSGGGGTQVVYTEGTQIADGTTVGTITVSGTAHAIKVPSKVSDLTNDSEFITADDIPTVPTKTSDLTNDSGYITADDIPTVPTKTSDLTNDSTFVTTSELNSSLTLNVGDTITAPGFGRISATNKAFLSVCLPKPIAENANISVARPSTVTTYTGTTISTSTTSSPSVSLSDDRRRISITLTLASTGQATVGHFAYALAVTVRVVE